MSKIRSGLVLCGLLLLVFSIGGYPVYAKGYEDDPALISPMGPFSLVHNPIAAFHTDQRSLWAALSSGGPGTPMYRLLAYTEPDTGFGAGALYWYEGRDDDLSRREVAYAVARRLSGSVVLGVSAKHVQHAEVSGFTGDVGLMVGPHDRLQTALLVHHAIGAHEALSTSLRLSAELKLLPVLTVRGIARLPVRGEPAPADWAVGLDFSLGPELTARVGQVRVDGEGTGQWYLGLEWEHADVVLSVSAIDMGTERRYAIGMVYRL